MSVDANGKPRQYLRIEQSQYDAEITAAEERGRASAVNSHVAAPAATPIPPGPSASSPASMSEPERLAAIDALGFSAEFPELFKAAKEQGLSVEATSMKLITAIRARGANPKEMAEKITAHMASAKAQGRRLTYVQAADEIEKAAAGEVSGAGNAHDLSKRLEDHIAKAKAEGRTMGPAQAAAELEAQGLF